MKMKEKGHSLEVFLFCRFPRRLCVISGGNGMGCVQSGWEGGQGGFLCVCVSVHAWGKDGSWEGMKQKKREHLSTPVAPTSRVPQRASWSSFAEQARHGRRGEVHSPVRQARYESDDTWPRKLIIPDLPSIILHLPLTPDSILLGAAIAATHTRTKGGGRRKSGVDTEMEA